jgi:hypothetical protein
MRAVSHRSSFKHILERPIHQFNSTSWSQLRDSANDCEINYSRVTMDDLDDELDLRYHRGLKPDVYYRCPTLEVITSASSKVMLAELFGPVSKRRVTK